MVVKPGQHPDISDERSAALAAVVKGIDGELYRERGAPTFTINIDRLNPLKDQIYKGWLHQELVRLYSKEGQWRYVTVFQGERGTFGGGSTWLYLSNNQPMDIPGRASNHIAGSAFKSSLNSLNLVWLLLAVLSALTGALGFWLFT